MFSKGVNEILSKICTSAMKSIDLFQIAVRSKELWQDSNLTLKWYKIEAETSNCKIKHLCSKSNICLYLVKVGQECMLCEHMRLQAWANCFKYNNVQILVANCNGICHSSPGDFWLETHYVAMMRFIVLGQEEEFVEFKQAF